MINITIRLDQEMINITIKLDQDITIKLTSPPIKKDLSFKDHYLSIQIILNNDHYNDG